MNLVNANMGEILSSGFRKQLDSNWSVVAYKLMRYLPEWYWSKFTSDMRVWFEDRPLNEKTIMEFFSKIEGTPQNMDAYRMYTGESAYVQDAMIMFGATMRMIQEDDAKDIVAWFEFCNNQQGTR